MQMVGLAKPRFNRSQLAPYTRGGSKKFYLRGGATTLCREYLWLLHRARSADGLVVPHLADPKDYEKQAMVSCAFVTMLQALR